MRKLVVTSLGIAAAALGAVALSAEPLQLSGSATDGSGDRSAVQGDSGKMLAALVPAGDAVRKPSETTAVGIAQAAPPAPDPSKPTAVDDGEDRDGPGDDADRPGDFDDDNADAPDDGEDAD